ncbi:response regulator transcription factor [Paenibacillus thalictri]|uniref:Response regulator n=1 Tax=Paenibacillus thalictri TaxID=2527873 RepID=A0A4Q9DWP6_9BACL|nr:response regulator [Paenibacillus thalictri]TBL81514.1 response regulator [Paenibacillus thalictri]
MNLLKVMLIDDEILAINHLKELIAWEASGYEIVAACTSSVKAFHIFEEMSPDIVIVDIRMPTVDGLELSRKMLASGRQVKIMLLTSYKEFEYAKQALELGISSYLLKHDIHEASLIHELDKLRNQLNQQKNRDNLMQGQYFKGIIEGRNRDLKIEQEMKISDFNKNSSLYFLLFELVMPYPVIPYNPKQFLKLPAPRFYDDLNFKQLRHIYAYKVPLGDYTWGLLLKIVDHTSEYQLYGEVHEAAQVILQQFKEQYDHPMTVGMSNRFDNLEELSAIYERAKSTVQYSIYVGRGGIISFQDFDSKPLEDSSKLKLELKRIADSLQTMDIEQSCRLIDQLFHDIILKRYEFAVFQMVCSELVNSLNRFRQKHYLGHLSDIEDGDMDLQQWWYTVSDIKRWFQEEFRRTAMRIKHSGTGQYSRRVQQIIAYIYEHYMEAICVTDIGETFNLSGDYVRRLFKEETGQTVSDFIVFVKMEKARQFLESGHYKVYEVSQMVGYTSQYFSQIFRKTYGRSPLEYVKKGAEEHESVD